MTYRVFFAGFFLAACLFVVFSALVARRLWEIEGPIIGGAFGLVFISSSVMLLLITITEWRRES